MKGDTVGKLESKINSLDWAIVNSQDGSAILYAERMIVRLRKQLEDLKDQPNG